MSLPKVIHTRLIYWVRLSKLNNVSYKYLDIDNVGDQTIYIDKNKKIQL